MNLWKVYYHQPNIYFCPPCFSVIWRHLVGYNLASTVTKFPSCCSDLSGFSREFSWCEFRIFRSPRHHWNAAFHSVIITLQTWLSASENFVTDGETRTFPSSWSSVWHVNKVRHCSSTVQTLPADTGGRQAAFNAREEETSLPHL